MTPQKKPGINAALVAQQVDELGAITRELAPYRLSIAKEEALRKAIRAQFNDSPAAEQFEAAGVNFTVILGAKALERSINPARLIKAIGLKVYASLARISLTALEANVDADIVAGVVTSANTGARSLKLFERAV